MSNSVFIVAACRTPIGSFQGQFEKIPSTELGSTVIMELLKRSNLKPEDIDQVILGEILTAGQGQNTARQTSIRAGLPAATPAFLVNMLCGSGLKAICLAFQAIRTDDARIVVAGGQENMSRAHHSAHLRGAKLGALTLADTLLTDGLTDAFHRLHMGLTAEHLVQEFRVSRRAQDEFALRSQQRAHVAQVGGHFEAEIAPVADARSQRPIESDEFIRAGATLESLGKLRPAFEAAGTVTAGNASGINDGAAGVALVSAAELRARGLKPLARIVAFAEVGVEPMKMGLGPVPAVEKVLVKAGWGKDEVDLFELNEAFAVQSILVIDHLKLDLTKVNVSGGAIALGHPIGASGARVVVTLIYNLYRLNKSKGIAALCIGGGMGIAIAIERC